MCKSFNVYLDSFYGITLEWQNQINSCPSWTSACQHLLLLLLQTESDFYGKFKKILRCPLVDHSEISNSGRIRDTLYLRDYDHPYFTYQE